MAARLGAVFAVHDDGSVRLLADSSLGAWYFEVSRPNARAIARTIVAAGGTWSGKWTGWQP